MPLLMNNNFLGLSIESIFHKTILFGFYESNGLIRTGTSFFSLIVVFFCNHYNYQIVVVLFANL